MVDKLVLVAVMMVSCTGPVYPDSHLTETRYCGEPARNKDGSIKRSRAVVEEFERLYPLPYNLNRDDFQINHAVPLICGGCDSVNNLIWMHKKAKTCAADYCQDRHEQITMCVMSFRK